MEEKQSLKETLQKLNNSLDNLVEQKKIKRFNIPFFSRLTMGNLKKNYVSICYIDDNKNIKFIKAPIDEGVIDIDGIPHLATAEHTLTYKGKPFIIVSSWNAKPYSPKVDLEEAKTEGTSSRGWKLIAMHLEKNIIKPKGNTPWGAIIFGLLVIGGIGYYLFSSGAIG